MSEQLELLTEAANSISSDLSLEIVAASVDLVVKMRASEKASVAETVAASEMIKARKTLGDLLFAMNSDLAHPEDADANTRIEAFAEGLTALLGTLAVNPNKNKGES